MENKITINSSEYTLMPFPGSKPIWLKIIIGTSGFILNCIFTGLLGESSRMNIFFGIILIGFIGISYYRWPNPLGGKWLRKMEIDPHAEKYGWVDVERRIAYK